MRALIVGGGGFIGSHLGDALLGRGDEVTVVDPDDGAKVRHQFGNPGFRYVRASLFDPGVLEGLVPDASVVYHLAGFVGVDHLMKDPHHVIGIAINGTQRVLEVALRTKTPVVFASTSEVYGRSPQVPFREDGDRVLGSTRLDRWGYATAKALSEHFCFAYLDQGLPVVVLRYFNVYGPRLDRPGEGRVISRYLGGLLRNEPILVVGDGSQTRCFTYIDDAIRATVAASVIPEACGGIFNVGGEEETSILALARQLIVLTGSRSEIRFVPPEEIYGPGYEEIPRRVPATDRMREILGVRAEVPLREGLRRTIGWFRAQAAVNGRE